MATTKKTRKNAAARGGAKPAEKKSGRYVLYGSVAMVVGVLLLIFMYIDSGGIINYAVKSFMLGLFGFCAYFIPFILIGNGIYCLRKRSVRSFCVKLILSFLFIVFISAMVHLAAGSEISLQYAYQYGTFLDGGGVFGALIACPMNALLHKVASFIILVMTDMVLLSLILGKSVLSAVWSFIRGVCMAIKDEAGQVEKVDAYDMGRDLVMNRPFRRQRNPEHALDVAAEFANENQPSESTDDPFEDILINDHPRKSKRKHSAGKDVFDEELFNKEKNIDESSHKENMEQENTDKPQNKKTTANEDKPAEDGIAEIFSEMGFDVNEEKELMEGIVPDYKGDDSVMPVISEQEKKIITGTEEETDEPKKKTKKELRAEEKKRAEMEQDMFHRSIDEAAEQPPIEYIFPSTDLLNKPAEVSSDLRREMFETSKKLISILADFGVQAKLSQVTQGPSVTRYEIQPSSGVKLSKIVGLSSDIALNLAVSNVLVAPVPGKAAVGIEIPNKDVSTVSIKEMLDSDEFKRAKSKLSVALGKDIGGRVVVGDVAKMPHVLIAGATGSGKSVCINTIITSILYKASPNEVKLIMVDPKVVELGVYNGIPHLLIPVVTDPKKAAGALNWAVGEMMRRYDLFADTSVRNLTGYNSLMEKSGGEKLPQLVIIIDELADLMMVAAKEVEDYICRLAQLARAAGIHLIIATQRPSVDVITGLIKANIPSRIAFSVSSQVDSRTILDRAGAEKLLGRGDMLYFPAGSMNPLRVQGAFVSDEEIENIVDFLKETGEENHYREDLAEHIERCASGENGVTPDEEDDGDELLPEAIAIAVELGQISTAMIQRKLRVGYSRAGRIIDQMEARGIISGANGSKPRQVYMSRAELMGIDAMAESDNEEE